MSSFPSLALIYTDYRLAGSVTNHYLRHSVIDVIHGHCVGVLCELCWIRKVAVYGSRREGRPIVSHSLRPVSLTAAQPLAIHQGLPAVCYAPLPTATHVDGVWEALFVHLLNRQPLLRDGSATVPRSAYVCRHPVLA